MEQRILYPNNDGTVSIVIPAPGLPIETIAKKDVPAGKSYKIVDVSDIPSDRTFRNAWHMNDGGVQIHMPKARDIHREKLRELRAPILAELDIEYQRADENGDVEQKKAIASQKQELRDVTADPAIEAATTPDDLKNVIPSCLNR